MSDTGTITCPGTYGGHLQGLAVDEDKAMYWSFTTDMVKTDTQGEVLIHIQVPSHHGDISYCDSMVFVAVNLGQFNKKEDCADNWIYAYNTSDFSLIWKHNIPEVFHGAGGMGYYNSHFFIVGGLPEGFEENYVYEYDENCEYVQTHTLDSGYTERGIQTACRAYGYWWLGCYGNPQKLLKTDDSFRIVGSYEFDCSLGITDIGDNRFLIGRRRGGHECMGQALSAEPDPEKGLKIIFDF